MAKKQMLFKTKGMNRDLSVSAFNPEFAFENMNLRLATNEGNTQMSWVNEKGTLHLDIVAENSDGSASSDAMNLQGTPIGTAIINHYLVLFTKGAFYDYIYRLKYTDNTKTALQCRILCMSGSEYMNLSVNHPLETLVSYESDNIQKVYWVDGINQPRLINICKEYNSYNNGVIEPIADIGYCRFDFIQDLQLNETVTVKKQLGEGGMFAPGVIQYSFTYYNKNGQESNIFYTTPLQYISYKERGASPEDKVDNSFKITITGVDDNFEYLRIYSIQRTSINGTPICKRIQDIEIAGLIGGKASFIDTGMSGDSIDPTELLYKGGEPITAETIEQKDNTLFFGSIITSRENIKDGVQIGNTSNLKTDITNIIPTCSSRVIRPISVSSTPYAYQSQLTSEYVEGSSYKGYHVPCGGFKTGNYYRLGIQFQHKSGKWSEPIFINSKTDIQQRNYPSTNDYTVALPSFSATISGDPLEALRLLGYKKARGCMVVTKQADRDIICQGVAAPTVYTNTHRDSNKDNDLYAQSSWFFRPMATDDSEGTSTTIMSPKSQGDLRYTSRQINSEWPVNPGTTFNPEYIRQVEVQGDYESDSKFKVDRNFRTLHSPDLEFDDQLSLSDFTGSSWAKIGTAYFIKTLSDIDIQTETPTVSNNGAGFVHKSFAGNYSKGIVSGLFYEDYYVDDDVLNTGKIGAYPYIKQSPKWLVYPWQGTGSLNNDIKRPTDQGVASAVLKKKVISNLRYASTSFDNITWEDRERRFTAFGSNVPQIFNSDEESILKINGKVYKGNIDTSIMPDNPDGTYYCIDSWKPSETFFGSPIDHYDNKPTTPFTSVAWAKTFSADVNQPNSQGLRKWMKKPNSDPEVWEWWWNGNDDTVGETFVDLVIKKLPVRMKYKSTPHLVCNLNTSISEDNYKLAILEIKHATEAATRYGGTSNDALKENIWIPCGEPVSIAGNSCTVRFDYGDTYFQRYDCLKTYPFTREDLNQIVEIGSFMLETYVNIDGRYDRNRGQQNNLNMSPQNFNLLNPVYSQVDNFFSYRIMDESYYETNRYPNQITWSKTKENGADVDLWTNITLASTLELDGDKGNISKLIRLNDQLLAFQDSGIAQILYNENAQLSTTQGVPVELGNSGKVDGKRYLSNTIGCSNKWSIVNTPAGIYFMDSNDKSIYKLGEGLQNVSHQGGMNSWCKQKIPATGIKWTPIEFNNFKGHYDKLNQEVIFTNKNVALAYSEKFGVFTSFYDYGNVPFFCNLDDTGIWVDSNCGIWKHQAGDYCKFFNENKPYWMTLVGNPEPLVDKTFTNLEFRACVQGEGNYVTVYGTDVFDGTFDYTFHTGDIPANTRYIPYLPFDSLESWNEYQHGITALSNKNGHDLFKHGGSDSSLIRKFRIWRCDVPRDNAELSEDAALGITRFKKHPNDRIRNPWAYLKLMKKAETNSDKALPKAEVHDVVMTYFD